MTGQPRHHSLAEALTPKERKRINGAAHYKKNRDKILKRQRERIAKNPEIRKAQQRHSRIKRKEKIKAYLRKYKEKNREKIKAYHARLYKENKERILRRNAAWRKNNPEKSNKINARYKRNHRLELVEKRKLHKEKIRENGRRWMKKNPDKIRAKNHRRRARLVAATGKFTPQEIRDLLLLQKNRCPVCKTKLKKYHLDHVMPLMRGGANNIKNIQLLCPPCNQRKHAKDPIDFMREEGFLI